MVTSIICPGTAGLVQAPSPFSGFFFFSPLFSSFLETNEHQAADTLQSCVCEPLFLPACWQLGWESASGCAVQSSRLFFALKQQLRNQWDHAEPRVRGLRLLASFPGLAALQCRLTLPDCCIAFSPSLFSFSLSHTHTHARADTRTHTEFYCWLRGWALLQKYCKLEPGRKGKATGWTTPLAFLWSKAIPAFTVWNWG